MKAKKIYLFLIIILILTLLFIMNKNVIFQEGNPITLLKGIIQLNEINTYVKIKDNPITYVTKSNDSERLFRFIEKENNVKFIEQMGSGYLFKGLEKSVTLTTRQYTRFYQVWNCTIN